MKQYIFLLCLCIISVQCSFEQDEYKEDVFKVMDLSGFENADLDDLKLSQIVHQDSLRYIRLETSSDCMISMIFDVEMTNQYIFLHSGGTLLVFDLEGNFIKRFHKDGRGPGEHLGIIGFAATDSLVLITSNYLRKIFFYNFEGNFLKTIDVNVSSGKPDILNDSLIVVHRRREAYIAYPDYWVAQIFNTEGDTIETKYPDISELVNMEDRLSLPAGNLMGNTNLYWYYNDTLYMNEEFNDTIYSVTDSGIIPRMAINSGRYKMPSIVKYHEFDQRYKYIWPLNFFENSTHIYIYFEFEEQRSIAGYNKKSGETRFYRNEIINDIDGGFHFTNFYSRKGNKLITVLYPYTIENRLKERYTDQALSEEKTKELDDLINSTNSNDNPIIILNSPI